MTTIATIHTNKSPAEKQPMGWPSLYRLAGVTALLAILIVLTDILLTFLPAGAEQPGTLTARDWFTLFQDNAFFGLRNLGLLPNILTLCLLIPIFLALYVIHRRADAALAMIVFLVGAGIYLSNNAAFPMWALSTKYAAATTEGQRTVIAAAGEAVLARGEDFTPGSFAGILLPDIAVLLVSSAMLRGGIFGKVTACTGMFGSLFLAVFTVWATFIPVFFGAAILLAMFGGLLNMAWYVLTARRLFQLSRDQ